MASCCIKIHCYKHFIPCTVIFETNIIFAIIWLVFQLQTPNTDENHRWNPNTDENQTPMKTKHPEWPELVWHTRGRVFELRLLQEAPVAAGSLAICRPRLHCARRRAHGALTIREGVPTSQLNLPSLTPLFIAGCGRLQPGVPHWATSVDYCK